MKLYRNIFITVIVIALLAAALYFVSQYQPQNLDNLPTAEETEDNMFQVYKTDGSQIIALYIKNADEEYELSLSGDQWILNNDSSIKLKQMSVHALVNTCANVSVKKVVADTTDAADSFGLGNPTGFVELYFADGSTKKIVAGNKTLDGQDYYISVEDDPKIYLKNTYGTESMFPQSLSLRDLSLVAIDPSNLDAIQSFSMSVQGKLDIKIENLQDRGWKVTKPIFAEPKGQIFVNNILNSFEAFDAVYVIEDHAKNMDLYGLRKPYAEFSIVTNQQSYEMVVGNETEAHRFLKPKHSDTVYAVAKSDLQFLEIGYMDLMSSLIHIENIDEITQVEIVSGEKKYEMKITGEDNARQYYINGIQLKKETFSSAYQKVLGIYFDSIDLSAVPKIEAAGYIKYTKKDGNVSLVEFLPINERNYRVVVNGQGNSITNKKNLNDVMKSLEDLVQNAQ
ncbi:MAG: DUF4340 domain-containing protein [Clostridia bacterium]|nr:DUF4340 domain-containing protein [Clostridia bacterium]